MTSIRGRTALATCVATILLEQATPVNAQSAEQCASTALSSVLATFTPSMKISFDCELSYLTGDELSECDSYSLTEKIDLKLDSAIGDACPSDADMICAAASAAQYDGLIYAAVSPGTSPEPDANRLRCRQTIGAASEKLAKKTASVLRKCNARALAGDAGYGPAGPECTDANGSTPAAIERAEQKLRSQIFRKCGGADRAAGGGDDLDPQDDLGFTETCRGGPDCLTPVPGLTELADCLICTAAQEVGEATTGALALPLDPVQACRVRIDQRYTSLAIDILADRTRCALDALENPDAPPCPTADVLAAIEANSNATETIIAEACASLDPQDDVGFSASCPDVGSCGSIDVSAMAGQLDCLSCVTQARTNDVFLAAYPEPAFEADDDKRDCRERVGDELTSGGHGFLRRKLIELRVCDRGRDCGITPDACPDQRRIDRIVRARENAYRDILDRCAPTADAEICLAHLDVCPIMDPQTLGFDTVCPDILGCGGTETDTFPGLATCLFCISDATADDLRTVFSPWP